MDRSVYDDVLAMDRRTLLRTGATALATGGLAATAGCVGWNDAEETDRLSLVTINTASTDGYEQVKLVNPGEGQDYVLDVDSTRDNREAALELHGTEGYHDADTVAVDDAPFTFADKYDHAPLGYIPAVVDVSVVSEQMGLGGEADDGALILGFADPVSYQTPRAFTGDQYDD